ncbi:MAG: glutamine amidotransferase [Thermoanaerobaculia bacterium]
MAWLESLFEFLFKYRPLLFEKGGLAFTAPWSVYIVVLAGSALGALAIWSYAGAKGRSQPADRLVLASLRLAILGLIVFCLFRPVLVISTVVPDRNFLGILIDDSKSMRIADRDETARSAFVYEAFGSEESELLTGLSERFMLRFFRFSGSADRIADLSELSFAGAETNLSNALDHARRDLAAVPLAGLVVVTDGAHNSETTLTESLLALKASSVPVYTVGLGRERFDRDIEVSRVETPRTVLKGSSLVVDLLVTQTGFDGETVPVDVEDEGRIISSRQVELPASGEAANVRVHFTVSEAGPRLYRFKVPALPGELVAQNNVQEALILVKDSREKVLYYEGEPRFEVKFIRRALADDDALQVVTLQRTAENKFLRLDVDDADELAEGFPKTREELFAYRGLMLGSVEASAFTHDQLLMITEFVSQRGGGLLMLGGRRAFAEGGYAGTPVADVLPVVLEPSADDGGGGGGGGFFVELGVEPTPLGETHPVTHIADTEEASIARWAELPVLSTWNRILRTKPGASTLLTGRTLAGSDRHVVLAYQRYGRGKAVAFPVQDSWMWQMHADIPLDDLTHETFWRQLLRWLVSSVPDRITVSTSGDRVSPGAPVTITAEVNDDTYLKVNNAEVVAYVTDPSGIQREIPMEWSVEKDGEYRASITAEGEGLYQIKVEARAGGETLGVQSTYVRAAQLDTEYFEAEMRPSLMKRIAEETGGRFYTPGTVRSLPEDVRYTESGTTVLEEKDLWDMPAIFLLLLGLVTAEWGYRRLRGLV